MVELAVVGLGLRSRLVDAGNRGGEGPDMTGVRDVTHGVRLRSVEDRDLDVFF